MNNIIFSDTGARILAPTREPRLLCTGFFFTEGPVWDAMEKILYFTNFADSTIHSIRPGGPAKLYRDQSGRAVGLSMNPDGTLVAAETLSHGIGLSDAKKSRIIVNSYQGKQLNSPNDVIVRSDGAVLFTDPYSDAMKGPRELGFNGFYCVPKAGDEYGEAILLDTMERPNGLALSPDEKILYVNDTNRNLIEAYQIRSDNTASKIGIFAKLDSAYGPGAADGMKVDVEGNVYVTGPGGLWALTPDGANAARIAVSEFVGNFCFGGENNTTIYLTASTSVYEIEVGIPGIVPIRKGMKQ